MHSFRRGGSCRSILFYLALSKFVSPVRHMLGFQLRPVLSAQVQSGKLELHVSVSGALGTIFKDIDGCDCS